MAQDTPKTPEDFAAAQKLAEAQAADAETKLIASQRTLAAAQQEAAATSAANLAATQQAAALAAAQQKQAEAQAATTKSQTGVPDSGYKGDVAAGSKAGAIESSLLAAKALNTAAVSICDKLTVLNPGDRVILYGAADLPNFQALVSYHAQRELVDLALTDALKKLHAANRTAPPGIRAEFITPATVGAALDAANKLLGFFRADYSVQGVDVKLDDLLLTDAMAASLLSKKQVKVQMPAVYNAPVTIGQSALLKHLNELAEKKGQVQQSMTVADKGVETLTAQAASEKDEAKKTAELQQIATLKEASASAKLAIGLYDAFFTKLTASDDKSAAPLAAILQQDAVSTLLGNGARLMTVKLAVSGGSFYTKKNMLTFFGGMPFYNMGGVVVTYTLFDGKTGDLLASGTVPVDGGYVRSNRLQKKLQEE